MIELGKTYTTRNGNRVKITDVDFTYSKPYFENIVDENGKHVRVASFNASGMYQHHKQTEFDIIGAIN